MSANYDYLKDSKKPYAVEALATLVRATEPLTERRLGELTGRHAVYMVAGVAQLEQLGIVRRQGKGYVCTNRREALAWLYRNHPELLPQPGVI